MKKKQTFKFLSNEWAVPYWVLALFALLLGIVGYFVNQVFGQETFSAFTKVLMIILIVLLSVFYKKLYITTVYVSCTTDTIEIEIEKYFSSKKNIYPYSEVSAFGHGTTPGSVGWLKVPERNWLHLGFGRKKFYLYEDNGNTQLKKLVGILQQTVGANKELDSIF